MNPPTLLNDSSQIKERRVGRPREKKVVITAPSGNVLSVNDIVRVEEEFRIRGWTVTMLDSVQEHHQRFAGRTETERLGEFNEALASGGLVLCARGGYGISRIIDKVNFDALQKTGTWVAGFSDITLFNLAYLALKGGRSLQSPTASVLGRPTVDPYTITTFFNVLDASVATIEFETSFSGQYQAEGILWGGNLSMLAAACGTPYMPNVGGILFIEDVGEPYYKVERDLIQLHQAGILKKQKCILAGHFSHLRPSAHDFGYSLQSAFNWITMQAGIPVISGLPFGHIDKMCTLNVGAPAVLRINNNLALLEMRDCPQF